MQERPTHDETINAASPLTAFTGEIQRTKLALPYTMGLAVVAFAMVLLPAVYMGLIGMTIWGIVYYLTHYAGIMAGSGGGIGRVMIFLGPPVAGCILVFFMLKPFFGRRHKRQEPLWLDAAREPLLFAFVQRVCELVHAPMPCRIAVDCQVNASASLRRGWWSKDLVLTVGLPLATGLNVREFAGVLAHEFGHFAQGAGMRLTYIIRNINFWFARVVFERDDWDLNLDRTAKRSDFRIALVLHAARGCIWLTRRILWGLMHAGNAISRFMLRQMEYDADSYEAKVAGSDAFESTMAQIQVLNAATQIAFEDVRNGWAGNRLPEDLPLLIQHKARVLPEELCEKVASERNTRKTGWFDTHPCDADRAKAVRRLGEAGVFRLEEPATGLFSDFAALSKAVTRYQYEKTWKLEFTAENLVSADETLRESAANAEADAAIRYFYGTVNVSLIPLIKEAALPPLSDFPNPKEAWQAAREKSESLKVEAGKISAECVRLQQQLLDLSSARNLTSAGFKIQPKEFGLPESATTVGGQLQAAKSAEQAASARLAQQMAQLDGFISALRTRVLLAIQLAPAATATPEGIPAPEALVALLAAVGATIKPLEQIGMRLRAFTALARNRGNHSQPEKVNAQMALLAGELRPLLGDVQSRVQGIPYPFPHPRGRMTIADYAHYEKPCANEWETMYRECNSHVERLFALHYRLLGKLLVAAEAADKAAP